MYYSLQNILSAQWDRLGFFIMSRQSTLTNYFQSISSPVPLTMSTKKRSLSLKRNSSKSPSTPSKSPKTPLLSPTTPKTSLTSPKMAPSTPKKTPVTSPEVVEVKIEEDIVILSSDSEQEATPAKRSKVGAISVKPIESLRDRTPGRTDQPQSELKTSAGASNISIEMMEYNMSPGPVLARTPMTPSSQNTTTSQKTPSSKGSSSTKEFYSPTKKRVVKKKSPVKRNLASQFNENFSPNTSFEDKSFAHNVEDRDDKSK